MNDILHTARGLQDFCDRRGWRCCLIGGIAVLRWGEARLTRDIDLTLLTGFGGEEAFVDALLGQYAGRLSDAREFALQHRVLLLSSASGVPLNISLGGLPFESAMMDRASGFSFGPGLELRTCSAEDLIVLKLFANRPRDVQDAGGVVARLGASLDWALMDASLRPLAEIKGDDAIIDSLERLRLR